MSEKKKIVTHSAGFHADDVFGVATLDLLHEGNIEVIRSDRNEGGGAKETGDYVLDIGMVYNSDEDKFDHHQKGGAGVRENDVPYASFGLLWKKFGATLCGSQRVADHVDRKLVQPIDAHDNGYTIYDARDIMLQPYLIQDIVRAFNPNHTEKEKDLDNAFLEMLEIAKKILVRQIVRSKYESEALENIKKVYGKSEDKQVIVFAENQRWNRELIVEALHIFEEPIYVIRKHATGSWQVVGMQDNPFGFGVRKPFPEVWGGKRKEELEEITGVSDALFCHRGLFMCVAESKEGALELARKALENE